MADRQSHLFETDPAAWEIDADADILCAAVVFPEAPRGEFDYLVPDHFRGLLHPGARVRVPLGRGNRSVVGYCVRLDPPREPRRQLKPIRAVIDNPPLISAEILELAGWIADHYLCELGEALEAVVPAGVRGQAGTRVVTYLHVPAGVAARLPELKLPAKQAAALAYLAAAPQPLTPAELAQAVGCTSGPLKALGEKQLVRAEKRREFSADLQLRTVDKTQPLPLHEDQQRALQAVLTVLRASRHETILLHGVTGSGKTEVYLQAIQEVIRFGRQAIVLVPEISLTPQTRRRFQARLDRVAVLHSNLTAAERHAQWQRIAAGGAQVVVGPRSAVFAPLPHLGLIVIDEEHEPSFKQDIAPRYHARDVAAWRAAEAKVPLVLGSATPALETWERASRGEIQLVKLPARVLGRPMPEVAIIDLRDHYRDRAFRGAISRPLAQAMKEALAAGGQVMLLLNRRGYSTHIQCPCCGDVVRCPHCDIALTHHREGERALCHYCHYQISTPPACPACGFVGIRFGGLGTQRLEAEVKSRFPDVVCLRMDSDSMRGTGSHEQALDRFRLGEARILLGTQMIAKGLDFPNVTLVGVVNADTALHLPDFRAGERTFQLVAQVAGRTGRGDQPGRVLVQSFSPDNAAITAAARHDYEQFARTELPARREFLYPPFSSVIRLVFRGAAQQPTWEFSQYACQRIRTAAEEHRLSARVLGPGPAALAKLRGKFRFHTLVLSADGARLRHVVRQATCQLKTPPGVQWIVDVDPVSML